MAAALASLDDRDLVALVEAAPVVAETFTGAAVRLDIAGVPVFAKRVPLTELERAHPRSTANLFALPSYYQYRLGSNGFGAWREVAAHELTTTWVLDGRCPGFPLAYHWRVLDSAQRSSPELLEWMAAFWGSPAVRERLVATARSTASVVLFLEYIPQTLAGWLDAQRVFGEDRVAAACAMVERETRGIASFMQANGFVHFDPHFRNLMTDGEHVYFADLGLASSRQFALADAELAFLERHASYDICVIARDLVAWLRAAYPTAMPAFAAEICERLGPQAAILGAFYDRLREDKTTPFPAELVATPR